MQAFIIRDSVPTRKFSFRWAILSDVHYGSSAFDEKSFKKVLEREDIDKFLLLGDVFDAISYRDKRFLPSRVTSFSDTFLDYWVDGFCKILEPIKDRLVGIGAGNHEIKALKLYGFNLSQELAKRLGVLYLGHTFYLIHRIQIEQHRVSFTIMHTHGWGGGTRTAGGSFTKYGRLFLSHPDADVILVGHDHHLGVRSLSCVRITRWGSIHPHTRFLALCGGFTKPFSSTQTPTFSEEKGFPINLPGWILMQVQSKRIRKKNSDRVALQLYLTPVVDL